MASKSECQRQRPLFALRGMRARRQATEPDAQVVTVGTHRGDATPDVVRPGRGECRPQSGVEPVRLVVQGCSTRAVAQGVEDVGDLGPEQHHQVPTGTAQLIADARQLVVPDIEGRRDLPGHPSARLA